MVLLPRPSDTRTGRRQLSRRRWHLALLAVAGVITAVFVYALSMVGVAVEQIADPVTPEEVRPEARPVPVQAGQRINILVMGLDDDRLRSDTMMLVSVDPEHKKLGVLQIPRDTRALLAGKGTYEKINAAYASGVGDKQFPPNLRALKTVEDLLDVSIHYTVVVDLDGFRKAIDAVGGVWVDIPFTMDYDDPTQDLHIHFTPGRQKLDGKQALEFVRWRGNNDGTGYPDGDLGRIRTQQQFLGSLMDEMLKPSNLVLLPNQLVAVSRHITTTMESGRILSLAKTAASFRRQDVVMATLPGTDAYLFDPNENKRLSFFLADPAETRRLVDRLIRGIQPEEAAKVNVEVTAPADEQVRVQELVERLREQGFDARVGTAVASVGEATRIVVLGNRETSGQLVARSLISLGYSVELVSLPEEGSAAVRILLGQAAPTH
ncbi:MAG TPA: LCP family protein [Symbiobacteriaceae bacterium]|nr:LCP family protein [Symbiobacteriaceae bacterium]